VSAVIKTPALFRKACLEATDELDAALQALRE
jgi:hypothetical protein